MVALLICMSMIQDEPPPPPREFRAAWVASVANIDWPSKPGLSTAQQKAEIISILNRAEELKLNALVWQIRPATDALYASKLEPWSEYLTGTQGMPPNPYYDPLEFIIDEAHKRGIELHCWFNPYRSKHPSAKSPLAPNHISRTSPSIVKKYGDYLWMDPGEKKTQDHSLAVMMDVVRRYDVDGVHIDDYFYPYKSYANNADFPDDLSWKAYQAAGGKLSRNDWRRKNVDDFVQRLYGEIKKAKPWVKFGISPFGIYRPGYPPDVKTTFDQYDQLYADARKWLVEGWCDYYSPQLYWRIKSDQPYQSLLKWWNENNPKKRHMWPGLFTGRISPSEGDWPANEIVDQIVHTRQTPATGHIHFSMRSLTGNWKQLGTIMRQGIYSNPALVPQSTWLQAKAPSQPVVHKAKTGEGSVLLTVTSPPNERWLYAYYVRRNGNWQLDQVMRPREAGIIISQDQMNSEGISAVAVSNVDRFGNESQRVRIAVP